MVIRRVQLFCKQILSTACRKKKWHAGQFYTFKSRTSKIRPARHAKWGQDAIKIGVKCSSNAE